MGSSGVVVSSGVVSSGVVAVVSLGVVTVVSSGVVTVVSSGVVYSGVVVSGDGTVVSYVIAVVVSCSEFWALQEDKTQTNARTNISIHKIFFIFYSLFIELIECAFSIAHFSFFVKSYIVINGKQPLDIT